MWFSVWANCFQCGRLNFSTLGPTWPLKISANFHPCRLPEINTSVDCGMYLPIFVCIHELLQPLIHYSYDCCLFVIRAVSRVNKRIQDEPLNLSTGVVNSIMVPHPVTDAYPRISYTMKFRPNKKIPLFPVTRPTLIFTPDPSTFYHIWDGQRKRWRKTSWRRVFL